mgnify:CR=1 FL=1
MAIRGAVTADVLAPSSAGTAIHIDHMAVVTTAVANAAAIVVIAIVV